MCEPVSITMGVMAVAGAAASIAGQEKQRSMTNTMEDRKKMAQNDLIAENRRRATKDYLRQVAGEQLQQRQQEEGVAEKSNDIARQARKTVATGLASAAERNVAGRTIDSIVSDYDFQADLEIGRIKENQKLANIQHDRKVSAYGDEFQARATAAKPYQVRPANPVDYFGPIFGAASQTLGAGVASGEIGKGNGFYGLGTSEAASPSASTQFGVTQYSEKAGPGY